MDVTRHDEQNLDPRMTQWTLTDEHIACIQKAVCRYRQQNTGYTVVGKGRFDELLEFVRDQTVVEITISVTDEEWHSLVALSVLGPSPIRIPDVIREKFHEVVDHHSGEDLDRILELAIAFGCGKWRVVNLDQGLWHGNWDEAILALARTMEPFIKESNIWLSKCVIGYPDIDFWKSGYGNGFIRNEALMITQRIIAPLRPLHMQQGQYFHIHCTPDITEIEISCCKYTQSIPPGGKIVFEVDEPASIISDADINTNLNLDAGERIVVLSSDQETKIMFPDRKKTAKKKTNRKKEFTLNLNESVSILGPNNIVLWNCTCSHKNCQKAHCLESWVPSKKISLWSFLGSAVKGPDKIIQSGTFIKGMYYPLLAREGTMVE